MRRRLLSSLLILFICFLIFNFSMHFYFSGKKVPRALKSQEASIPQLNSTADFIEAWFKTLIASITAPLDQIDEKITLKGTVEESEELFSLLSDLSKANSYHSIPIALCLFDESGKAIAWSSDCNLTNYELPPPFEEPIFSLRKDGSELRLNEFRRMKKLPLIAASELLIESNVHRYTFQDLLPESIKKNAIIQLELFEKAYKSEEIASLFSRLGKRFLSKEEGSLYVALRAGKDSLIGVAKVSSNPSPGFFSQWPSEERSFFFASLLLFLFILCLILFLFSCHKSPGTHAAFSDAWRIFIFFLLASLALASFRLYLLIKQFPGQIISSNISGPIYFGTSEFHGFLGSPVDLLITSCMILAQVSLVFLFLSRIKERIISRLPAFFLLLLELVLTVSLVLFSLKATTLIVQNSRINIFLFEYGSYGVLRLILQSAILLLFFSAALSALSAVHTIGLLAIRKDISTAPLFHFRFISFSSIAVTCVVFFLLDNSYSFLKNNTILKEFRYEILQQEAKNRQLLAESLKKVTSSTSLFPNIFGTHERDDTIAFDLWDQTELAALNTSSSLEIYNRESKLISQFTQNLPGFNEKMSLEGRTSLEPKIFEEEFSVGSTRGKVLHGELPVASGGMIAGMTVIHILDQPENIPFLTLGKPFSEFYRKREANLLYSELIGVEPPFIVYGQDGKISFSNITSPPPLPESIKRALHSSPGEWVPFISKVSPNRFYALWNAGRTYVTGYPVINIFQKVSLFIKLAFISLIIGCLILAIGHLIYRPSTIMLLSFGNFIAFIRRSYYRKLLIAIIIASLIPLLSIAFIIRGYIENRAQDGIRTSGLNALAASRRVVKDYLSIEIEEAGLKDSTAINDEVLYWLNRIVRHDINIYSDGLLKASSRRDLFLSGLLPYRLDSEAYRRIILQDEPYHVKEETSADRLFYTFYAAIDIPTFHEGVISIPLDIGQSNILREVKNIDDMILIITISVLILLWLVAYLTASSISKPVVRLVDATERLASGDYETRIQPTTSDETMTLTKSFNEMAASLKRQREDLERRKDYIEKILRNITAGVISTDTEGTIITVNPAASMLLSPGSALGEGDNLLQFFKDRKGYSELKKILEQSFSSPAERIESEIELSVSEKPLQLRIVLLPLFWEERSAAGRILVIEDMTEMIRSNRLSAWAEMAKNIAHEIKNPLTPIQLSAEHLQKVHRDGSADMDRIFEECLSTIMKQVRELRRISEDFSSYAKMPELKKDRINPVTLMKDLLSSYRISLRDRIAFSEDYADTPDVFIDRKVMKGALTNIIENSIQAITDRGKIMVSVRRSQENPDTVIIIISDTGPGVPMENLDKLFDPYFSTKEHGTGMGLAITKKVIEEHGGTIHAASEPQRGMTMTIKLPAIS